MRAWAVAGPGRLVAVSRDEPVPGPGEILVRVLTCGVCRTDLHVLDGDLPVHRRLVIPGHEIVGEIVGLGKGAGGGSGGVGDSGVGASGATADFEPSGDAGSPVPARFEVGQRVGIPWLRHTCGVCRWCRSGRENLCVAPAFTGWDADGGYAEYAIVDAAYAYAIPPSFSDEKAAPLLCAGIIGFRALRRASLPVGGGRLGLYGFGGSAHLAAQVALYEGSTVHVITRSVAAPKGRSIRPRSNWTPPSSSRLSAHSSR
jgi:propanol-preferring alcohol dehydrogenase